MPQTKLMSFIEAWSNIFIGYIVNLIANALILPHFVEGFTFKDNLCVGVIYTAISLIRQYVIRRWFNNKGIIDESIKGKDGG